MNKYTQLKERARDKAIEWQNDFNNHNYSYGELAYYGEYFKRLAKRYGLVGEFRENGII
jgi:hypothetical protein